MPSIVAAPSWLKERFRNFVFGGSAEAAGVATKDVEDFDNQGDISMIDTASKFPRCRKVFINAIATFNGTKTFIVRVIGAALNALHGFSNHMIYAYLQLRVRLQQKVNDHEFTHRLQQKFNHEFTQRLARVKRADGGLDMKAYLNELLYIYAKIAKDIATIIECVVVYLLSVIIALLMVIFGLFCAFLVLMFHLTIGERILYTLSIRWIFRFLLSARSSDDWISYLM